MDYKKIEKTPFLRFDQSTICEGDALDVLRKTPTNFVQTVITSPPYWGMRDYGVEGQFGHEKTLDQFVNRIVGLFSEVKRVLKDNGTLWLNIGDGYTSGNRGYRTPDKKNPARAMKSNRPNTPEGLKKKDLLGVPWRIALGLQADGWYLRSDIIWNKPNAMPESVKDRPTRSHEYMFMLTKSEHYLYNYREAKEVSKAGGTRNLRSVWDINTNCFGGDHYATFPIDLVTPCILASTKTNDFILDPFFGTGTVGVACNMLNRHFIGCEINPHYVEIARARLKQQVLHVVVNG